MTLILTVSGRFGSLVGSPGQVDNTLCSPVRLRIAEVPH